MVLPSSMRLKGRKCFNHLLRSGKRFHSPSILLRVVRARPEIMKDPHANNIKNTCRCAVAISSKVSKKAVIRNRLRRMLHQHLRTRLEKENFRSKYWALITIKPSTLNLESKPILDECDKLLTASGLLQ